MSRRRCSYLKKTGLGIIAQLALNPDVWKLAADAYQKLSQEQRAELIKQFEAQRIPEWSKVRLTVVFDWSKGEYIAADKLTLPQLQNTNTKVYVNEWGLPNAEPALANDGAKNPAGLSHSYRLFSGELNRLFKLPPESDSISPQSK